MRLNSVLAAAASAAALLVAACAPRRRATVERVHAVGPFELVTTAERYTARYGDADFHRHSADAVYRRYLLRYRGEPVTFVGKAGMGGERERTYRELDGALTWNGTGAEPDAPAALIALVRDRDSDGDYFYLVRDAGSRADVQYLAQDRNPILLDGPHAGSVNELPPPGTRPTSANSNDYWDRVEHRDLTGGRFVYFPDVDAVLDLRRLAWYPLVRLYRQRLDFEVGDALVAAAPDGLSIVRPAYPVRGAQRDVAYDMPTLLETDLATGSSTPHPVSVPGSGARDEARDHAALRALFAREFTWRRDSAGRDRLVRRGASPDGRR